MNDLLDAATVARAILARTPEHLLVPSLDRIRALMDLLGNPQRGLPILTVTGTNGKTTTARMADALLRQLGLRTGRFTSPHLHRMQERITIDGEPIDDERFVQTFADVAPYLAMVDAGAQVPTSFFEVLTAMAYAAFADAPVSAAVVEVGMGGAWDATNVADASVAVLTPIALDHQRYLGSTIESIATEKAGIIKAGAVAVVAEQPPEAAAVIARRVAEVGASAVGEGRDFGVRARRPAVGGQVLSLQGLGGRYEDVLLPLFGSHQARNAATALAAVEAFLGGSALDAEAVAAGFAEVTSPGRLEVVRRSPTVLLDAAHNPAGAAATAAAVSEEFGFTRLIGLVAAFADKDVRGILSALEPVLTEVVVSQTSAPRAMPADDLAAVAVEVFGADRVQVEPRLPEAVEAAITLAEESGEFAGTGVLVTGSILTVAEVRALLGRTDA